MIAVFNENSLQKEFTQIESERIFKEFLRLCLQFYTASKAVEGNDFNILIRNDFYQHPLVKDWQKRFSKDFVFLYNQILKQAKYDIKISFVISLTTSDKFTKSIVKYQNKEYPNASFIEHFYIHLQNIPIWNNYNFENWKPNFDNEERLLSVAKLSDFVWLKFIEKDKIWNNIQQREFYWNEFVEKLRHFSGGGNKEGILIPLFLSISNINGFKPSQVCAKPKRKIVEFSWTLHYLACDKMHGAFEVYNYKSIHQGEWNFYGKKNTNKKADATRDICN